MILALDISTSITGASVIDIDGNIVFCEAWDLRKIKNIFEKATKIKSELMDVRKQFAIRQVYIEQPFMFFNSGGSSAKTMAVLQRFNGIVSWLCLEQFFYEPLYLTAGQARKLVGLKIPRGQKAKPVVLQFVLDNDPTFEVEYTKHGNPKPGVYDRADSWILAKAGCEEWKQKSEFLEAS
jgi:Holliday junction resolvasome RuvABC endonuclease subunit